MNVLYVLVPLALAMASAFVVAFVWATRQGQFDDLETPALRMLVDDRPLPRRSDEDTAAAAPVPRNPG